MNSDSKLTLKLNTNSILKAKNYVAQKGISLSKLVEDFFDGITSDSNSDSTETTSYSPLVKYNNTVTFIISHKSVCVNYALQ